MIVGGQLLARTALVARSAAAGWRPYSGLACDLQRQGGGLRAFGGASLPGRGVFRDATGVSEVCDANPYLFARREVFHRETKCGALAPICRKEQLTLVSWVFGEHLGAVSGFGSHPPKSWFLLTTRFLGVRGSMWVEVCRTCSWNHLVKSYVLGTPRPGAAP